MIVFRSKFIQQLPRERKEYIVHHLICKRLTPSKVERLHESINCTDWHRQRVPMPLFPIAITDLMGKK
jgi:hypothetical protein